MDKQVEVELELDAKDMVGFDEPLAAFTSPDINSCRLPRPDATHLPAELYTSEEVFEREKELLFFRDWIVMAREDEFKEPGDYRTFEMAGEKFIIARGRDGELRAFINSCRHRGTPIAYGEGNVKAFVCPYHAWTYDLTGKLINPLRSKQLGNFDTTTCRLPELKIGTFGGFVFVNFDPNARSLEEFLDSEGFREELSFLRCEDLATIDNYTFDMDANWKVVMEVGADVYHVEVVHKETFGKASIGFRPTTSDSDVRLTKYGATKKYNSPTFAPGGSVLFGQIPWLKDMPGGGSTFAMNFHLRPNMAFFARCDMIQPWVAIPLGVNKTRFITWTCIPREYVGTPGFDEKVQLIKDFCRKVNDEDRDLTLAIQSGMTSRYFPRGPIHELERVIHHKSQGYLHAMTHGGDFD
ncbi:aromatic ring-hydroxylating oxygenase subunit alpha [Rhizobium sp. CF142]|uniref:aromatic ring-hydroxylating oxygenase subunit alpha n=1 Tax=Rhizobium sp. CF142 TaxID=1144314 RepID=UPI00026EEC29|nr:aromatic ring-hydroxylating dioxygenase subunit alpha [Rhizobium sp. CF142]EJJ26708.1 ring-hydroxylating dioxygenase, large terminal subunit [Rhizobium sp. CF142]